jgi:decaprenylphospho-beta-D-erythro-pentofuranosid-2-ulose 2-reductase
MSSQDAAQGMAVVVFGATAAMVQETIRRFAAEGARLFLVARHAERLETVARDATVRGALAVTTRALDLDDTAAHPALVAAAIEALGRVDVVLVAHGLLGDQRAAEADFQAAAAILHTNFTSAVSLLTPLANQLEGQRHGVIGVITSVAGDRGRQSNYTYGAAKGALALWLQGLRNRLSKHGVRVVTIKPGFVATPMTAHLPRGPLVADAAAVGAAIHRVLKHADGEIYLPRFWWGIMAIIKSIPEPLFKRLSL